MYQWSSMTTFISRILSEKPTNKCMHTTNIYTYIHICICTYLFMYAYVWMYIYVHIRTEYHPWPHSSFASYLKIPRANVAPRGEKRLSAPPRWNIWTARGSCLRNSRCEPTYTYTYICIFTFIDLHVYVYVYMLIKRTPPPGGLSYLLCSLIKNRV